MPDEHDTPTDGERVVAALDAVDREELSELLTELLVEAVDAERDE
jgi:hypothetical protein